MKNILIVSIVAALLGGCIITPAGYSDHRDGYYQRGNNRGDGYYRDNGYRDYGYQGSPYRDHGG